MDTSIPPKRKRCPRCKKRKPITDFRRKRNGYQDICKDCSHVGQKHIVQLPLFLLWKICSKCGKERDIDQFSRNKYGADGYHSRCNPCRNECDLSYRETHREQIRKRMREHDNTPERIAFRRLRYQERCIHDPDAVATGWQVLHEWQIAHPEQNRERGRRRDAHQKGATTDKVNYAHILERDGFFCHICEEGIDPTIKKGPARLEFDHVTPIQPRYGEPQGTHSEDNIKPAHLLCNKRKGNKPFSILTSYDKRGID